MTDKPKDMKFDEGKPRVELIEPEFIMNMGRVMGHGAKKYREQSWKTDVANPAQRYLGAALRHLLDAAAGKLIDDDSGLPTLSHAACSVMMLQYHLTRPEPVVARGNLEELARIIAKEAAE